MDYDLATKEFIDSGISVFQGAMFSADEKTHCEILYSEFAPKGVVVDMGCGVGGVGRYFKQFDPTLSIIGVTNNTVQAESAFEGMAVHVADMAQTGLDSEIADVVMFNESFGYGHVRALLDEAFRVLKPGGKLCIKDFGFLHHEPAIGLTERNWDYTVHDPDVLALYAGKVGFVAEKMLRHLRADFSRWHQFMSGYTKAEEHGDIANGDNICAAIYVFKKPATKNPNTTLSEILLHNPAALDFCHKLYDILHLWDDLIDGDTHVTHDTINKAFRMALVDLPLNPFYAANVQTLAPILASGISAWYAANVFENSEDRELWRRAHTLRVNVGAVYIACAEIVGGYEWGVKVAPEVYTLVQADTLDKYMAEMEMRHGLYRSH